MATYRLDPVANDIPINPSHRIVVIEGNYIQLTIPPWDEATRLLDEKWFITVERDVARGRVITRHLVAGIAKTEEEAGKRFDENDWPNGEFLLQNSNIENADKKIHSVQDPHLSAI
jgi:pantothenate kinase